MENGSFKGLCARGGIEIDASWKNARIENTVFKATAATEFILRLPNAEAYRWKLNKKHSFRRRMRMVRYKLK